MAARRADGLRQINGVVEQSRPYLMLWPIEAQNGTRWERRGPAERMHQMMRYRPERACTAGWWAQRSRAHGCLGVHSSRPAAVCLCGVGAMGREEAFGVGVAGAQGQGGAPGQVSMRFGCTVPGFSWVSCWQDCRQLSCCCVGLGVLVLDWDQQVGRRKALRAMAGVVCVRCLQHRGDPGGEGGKGFLRNGGLDSCH